MPRPKKTLASRDPRERFIELAESRTIRALEDIRLIGNLANRANYEWKDEDVSRIFEALGSAIKAAERRFRGDRFSLADNQEG
jgi:hypothetical protein